MKDRVWSVTASVGLCFFFGFAGYQGWKMDHPEVAMLAGALVLIGLLAIYDTITGRRP